MKIIISNQTYDVTTFVNEHPGGNDVFKDGADMTNEFNKVGHSKHAIKLLEKYKVDTGVKEEPVVDKINIDDITIPDFLYMKFKNSSLSKLFTHEDYLNCHKILGGIALVNILYFLYDLLYSGCKGEMTLRKPDGWFVALAWVQFLLSLSSLQFSVPKNINYTTAGITSEFRLHSIIFALRSILIITVLYLFGKNIYTHIAISCIAIATMYAADLISRNFKDPDNKLGSKVNAIPFWTGCHPLIIKTITHIYTLAQVFFTSYCFHSSIEVNFYALFVIQITAFMGTLSKKMIINNFQWHAIYLFEYLLGFILFFKSDVISFTSIFTAIICWILRTKMNMNKFYLWTTYSVLLLFTKYIKNNYYLVASILIVYFIFNSFNLCFDKKREIAHNVVVSNELHKGVYLIKIQTTNVMKYHPGQYFNIYVNKEKRSYSPIANDEKMIDFAIKPYGAETISQKICNLVKNSYIYLDGPFGNNYYNKELDKLFVNGNEITCKKILMFCCGTGITPFYSILKNLHTETQYKFKLYSSFKSEDHVFLKIKQHAFYSRLDEPALLKIIKKYDKNDTCILVCGTDSYNKLVLDTLREYSVYTW